MDVEKNTHLTISWDLHDKKFHQNTSNFAIFKEKENPNVFFVSSKLCKFFNFFSTFFTNTIFHGPISTSWEFVRCEY